MNANFLSKNRLLSMIFLFLCVFIFHNPAITKAGTLTIAGNVAVENIKEDPIIHKKELEYKNTSFYESKLFNNPYNSPTIQGKTNSINGVIEDNIFEAITGLGLYILAATTGSVLLEADELMHAATFIFNINDFANRNYGTTAAHANFNIARSTGIDPDYQYFDIGKLGVSAVARNSTHAWAYAKSASSYNFDVISPTDKPIKLSFSSHVAISSLCDDSYYFDYYSKVKAFSIPITLNGSDHDGEDPLWFSNYIFYGVRVSNSHGTNLLGRFIKGPFEGNLTDEIEINPYDNIANIEMIMIGVAFSGFEFAGDEIPGDFAQTLSYNSLKMAIDLPEGVTCTTDYGVTFGGPVPLPSTLVLLGSGLLGLGALRWRRFKGNK